MNKYHLARVLDRMHKRRNPGIEHVAIPFTMFWALLLALLPTDFQDYIGIKAATWESLAFGLTWLSGIVTVVLFVWWAYNIIRHPSKEPETIVDEIIDEMEKDRERLMRRQAPDK